MRSIWDRVLESTSILCHVLHNSPRQVRFWPEPELTNQFCSSLLFLSTGRLDMCWFSKWSFNKIYLYKIKNKYRMARFLMNQRMITVSIFNPKLKEAKNRNNKIRCKLELSSCFLCVCFTGATQWWYYRLFLQSLNWLIFISSFLFVWRILLDFIYYFMAPTFSCMYV